MGTSGSSEEDRLGSLPAWRHGLSREYVEDNQRARIREAVLDVNGLAGYGAMSVEDIVRTAGVSRRSFYDLYSSKEDAFLSVLDDAVRGFLDAIRDALAREDDFARAVGTGVAAALRFLVVNPRHAELMLVDAPAAGDVAVLRRRRIVVRLAGLLDEHGAMQVDGPRPPRLTAEAIVGGIVELAAARVARGEFGSLPDLAAELSYALLAPYLGREAALRESGLDGSLTEQRADAPS